MTRDHSLGKRRQPLMTKFWQLGRLLVYLAVVINYFHPFVTNKVGYLLLVILAVICAVYDVIDSWRSMRERAEDNKE